ncbi:hypothetical protein Esti_005517 [Eimeria stiedai]
MALEALRKDLVTRLRRCAMADGEFFSGCLQVLENEQYQWMDFIEQAHDFLAAQLVAAELLTPIPPMDAVSQLLRCIPELFRETEAANHRFLQARRRQAIIVQQYSDLETALTEVPVVFDPSNVAAAAEVATAIQILLHLENLVRDKEQDVQQDGRLQRALQDDGERFLPRLLFVVTPLTAEYVHEEDHQPSFQRLPREAASPVAPSHGQTED